MLTKTEVFDTLRFKVGTYAFVLGALEVLKK
jgi:hypothetical protein